MFTRFSYTVLLSYVPTISCFLYIFTSPLLYLQHFSIGLSKFRWLLSRQPFLLYLFKFILSLFSLQFSPIDPFYSSNWLVLYLIPSLVVSTMLLIGSSNFLLSLVVSTTFYIPTFSCCLHNLLLEVFSMFLLSLVVSTTFS